MAVPQFTGGNLILGAVNQLAQYNAQQRAIEEQKRREREARRANQFGMIGGGLGAIGGAMLGGPAGAAVGYGAGSMIGQTIAGQPPPPQQTIPLAFQAAGAVQQYQQQQQQQAAQQELQGAVNSTAGTPYQSPIGETSGGLYAPGQTPTTTPQERQIAGALTRLGQYGPAMSVIGGALRPQAGNPINTLVQTDQGIMTVSQAQARGATISGKAPTASAGGAATFKVGDTRDFNDGNQVVTQEYTNDGWVELARAPRWQDQAAVTPPKVESREIKRGDQVVTQEWRATPQGGYQWVDVETAPRELPKDSKPVEPADFGRGDPLNIVDELSAKADAGGSLTDPEARRLNLALAQLARPTTSTDAQGNTIIRTGQNAYDDLPQSLQADARIKRPTISGAVGAKPTQGAVQPTYSVTPTTPPRPSPQQQEALGSSEVMLKNMKSLAKVYKPELVGPAAGRALRAKAALPGFEPTAEEAELLGTTAEIQNRMIKLITGAQMSEPEAQRIKSQLPDINQHPSVFEANFNRTYENARMLNARIREMGNLGALDENLFPESPPELGNVRQPDMPPAVQSRPPSTPTSPRVMEPARPPAQWDVQIAQEVPIQQITPQVLSQITDPAVLDALIERLGGQQ